MKVLEPILSSRFFPCYPSKFGPTLFLSSALEARSSLGPATTPLFLLFLRTTPSTNSEPWLSHYPHNPPVLSLSPTTATQRSLTSLFTGTSCATVPASRTASLRFQNPPRCEKVDAKNQLATLMSRISKARFAGLSWVVNPLQLRPFSVLWSLCHLLSRRHLLTIEHLRWCQWCNKVFIGILSWVLRFLESLCGHGLVDQTANWRERTVSWHSWWYSWGKGSKLRASSGRWRDWNAVNQRLNRRKGLVLR